MSVALSVIIPAYNVGKYLSAAIDSALAQTLEDIEIIVVNDGSTDDTEAVLERYRHQARVTSITQANQGVAAARNAGIALATGRYIGCLDGDDLWHPTKAAKHVALMDANEDLDMSFSWLREIDEQGEETGARPETAQDFPGFEDFLFTNLTFTGSTVVLRRSALDQVGAFDSELRSCEDHEMWIRIASIRPRNIACLKEVLVDYRIHATQTSKNWRATLDNWSIMMAKVRSLRPDLVAKAEPAVRALHLKYIALLAYNEGDYRTARALIFRALATRPWLILSQGEWLSIAAVVMTILPGEVHGCVTKLKNARIRRRAQKEAS